MVGDVFSILTVCTGNICRSPLGEQLLAQQLADLVDVRVASAGTGALVGHGMPDQSLVIARSLGVVDPESHVSRQLTPELLDESDVVFAMAREHRRAIVELNPRVSKRVFTLREFARLADATSDDDLRAEFAPGPFGGDVPSSPVERLRAGVAAVAAGRGMLPPLADPLGDDVVDPYRRSQDVYDQSTREIVPAVASIVSLLRRALALEV